MSGDHANSPDSSHPGEMLRITQRSWYLEHEMTKHPGQVLFEDFMTPLEISSNHLANSLGVNRSTIGRLIASEHRMTPEMAARLGAYFGVPARWWLSMQAEFDAGEIATHPELSDGVTPMEPNPDVLITPKGVLRLDASDHADPGPAPISLSRKALEKLPEGAPPRRREVRVVHRENGSIALVEDSS